MVKDEVRNALIQVRDMQLTGSRVEQLIVQRADEIRKERTMRRRKPSKAYGERAIGRAASMSEDRETVDEVFADSFAAIAVDFL